MDKFTVDLDQVLNDFEYSELTDQYNASAKVADSSTTAPNQNVSKHSINNVFHSLNEYLNTNLNSVDPIDNNTDHIADFANPIAEEKSIREEEEIKTDVNAISQSDELPEVLKDTKDDLIVDTETEVLVEELVSNSNEGEEEIPRSCNSVDLLDPVDHENMVQYESTEENHVDLQTELQNVVGNNFGVKCEQNSIKPLSEELKTVIGFEHDLHLYKQEISRLLTELEEDE